MVPATQMDLYVFHYTYDISLMFFVDQVVRVGQ
jgi:hypothetical protein